MREDIDDRSNHMRKIPDKAIRWMSTLVDHNRLIYKKHGRYATCFCTKCGAVYEGCIRQKDSYEGQFEPLMNNPEHNQSSVCSKCGAKGIYKASGRYRGETFTTDAIIGQKSGEDFVWRVFRVQQFIYSTDFTPTRIEKSSKAQTEYIRWFLVKGKKAQKDYLLYSWAKNIDEWYPHNIGRMNNIPFPWYAPIYSETGKEIKNTPMFKYIPEPGRSYHPVTYYAAAARYYKDFEFVAKKKLDAIERGLISGTVGYRQNGKTPADRLGIYKERLVEIINTNSIRYLELYKWEKQLKTHWSKSDVEMIKELQGFYCWNDKFIKLLLRYSSPAKVGRYLKKIQASSKWRERDEYKDYIRMRQEEGYDLSNEIILFPKDLHRRHNEMVLQREKAAIDKRCKEVLERFKKIPGRYKKLDDKYSAAAGGYIIRPAKDAAEIVMEGRILHHCVGGDGYLRKHNNGESFILFLRKVKEKDEPYITVEIKGNEIVQWYGEYDRKPNQNLIEAWLKTYTKELAKREKKPKQANCAGTTKGRKTA